MTESVRYILEGNQANFDELVLNNSRAGLVAVDFWAPWVGPSLRQRELLIRAAKRFEGRFLLVSVNTDENPRLASRFGIRSLPLFKLFRHGREIETFHGVQPEADYPRIFARHLGGDTDPVIENAVRLWQGGQPEQALRELAEAAVQRPEESSYPILMVKLLMRQQRIDDALAILDALPEGLRDNEELAALHAHLTMISLGTGEIDEAEPRTRGEEDAEARFRSACRLVVGDRYEEALEQLLYLAREHPRFRDGMPRRCMIALFRLLDEGDEVLLRYRSALFQLDH